MTSRTALPRRPRLVDPPASVAASLWGGARIPFLESMDTATQLRVFDLTARTAQAVTRWAAKYPLMRRSRIWPLTLSLAAAMPFGTVQALTSVTRYDLCVFTLDDLFDEERVPEAELMRRAERYRAVALGQVVAPTTAPDGLAEALREVREDLAGYALFPALGRPWAEAFGMTVDAMVAEHRWRLDFGRNAALPSYDEYLSTGIHSINGPPHVWATLITLGDASVIRYRDELEAMGRDASTCIRLANDLQTYPKEVEEGKINALVILGQALQRQGAAHEEAHRIAARRVRDEIGRGLAKLAALRESPRTVTGRPEATIADIARFACDFYVQHDYHTFTAQRV